MRIPRVSAFLSFLLIFASLALSVAVPALADDDAAFQANCAKCHGAEGKGDTAVGKAMKVPSLPESDLGEMEATAICEKAHAITQHKSFIEKLDADTLAAACRRIKELASAS